MEQKKEVEKSCENCRYFLQHYIKRKTGFHSVNCGHCTRGSKTETMRILGRPHNS